MTDTTVSDESSIRANMAQSLSRMADLQVKLIAFDNEANRQIQAILLQLELDTRPLVETLEAELAQAEIIATNEWENLVEPKAPKTATFITGVIQKRSGSGKVVVDDASATLARLRQDGRLRRYTNQPERVLDKTALKESPEYVDKLPGVRIESGTSTLFTPTQTNVSVDKTLKAAQSALNKVAGSSEN